MAEDITEVAPIVNCELFPSSRKIKEIYLEHNLADVFQRLIGTKFQEAKSWVEGLEVISVKGEQILLVEDLAIFIIDSSISQKEV